MKPFILKKDSWHYKYMSLIHPSVEYHYYNLCSYIWGISFWLTLHAVVATIVALVCLVIGDCLFDQGGYLYQHPIFGCKTLTVILLILAGAGSTLIFMVLIILGSVAIFLALGLTAVYIKGLFEQPSDPGEDPGFLSLAWTNIRNKTCVKIKFE